MGTGSIPEAWDPQVLAGETQGSWQHLVTSVFHTTDFSRSLATKGPRSRGHLQDMRCRRAGRWARLGGGLSALLFFQPILGKGQMPAAALCPFWFLGLDFFGFCVGGWGSRGRWPCMLTGRTGPAAHTRPASLAML